MPIKLDHHFSAENFLTTHWQKSPLFYAQAFQTPPSFVSPDELAGLALEEEIESRLISFNTQKSNQQLESKKKQWRIEHGPFDEDHFASLPESNWTLLVQTIEHWLPEIYQLVEAFKFIPRWRFDDVMVSFATDKGGVGPHFDNYDVFLIQGEGQRRWRVGAKGDTKAKTEKINGLLHLESFTPVIDVVMNPGDMLYIPPDTPHWGESIGDSIGYSVGYRAPQTRDIFALLANHLDSNTNSINQFFTDEYRNQTNISNQIEPELIKWAQNEIKNIADNQQLISSLLSQFLSTSKIEDLADEVEKDEKQQLIENDILFNKINNLKLKPHINSNWFLMDNQVILSINNEQFTFEKQELEYVSQLASGEAIDFKRLLTSKKHFTFCETLTRIKHRGYFLYN